MHKITGIVSFILPLLTTILILCPACQQDAGKEAAPIKFGISFSSEINPEALDGRILLLLSTNDSTEPRFQINDGPDTQMIFGIDINGLSPGEEAFFDAGVLGYPLKSLADIPAGEYFVQGLLHIYETFNRADGHVVKLPMDRGEGQHWNQAPGNLFSIPEKIYLDPGKNQTISINMDQKIPSIPDPAETKYIKHVKIQSKLLSEFWGRPMFLGAHVLLPEGFDEHPQARYPLVVFHGHFPYTFGGFREEPPDPDLEPDYSARFDLKG